MPQQPKTPEAPVLSNREKIIQAMKNTLSDDALVLYSAMISPIPYPQESFHAWIAEFNALPASARGEGQYDHGRTLGERDGAEISDLFTAHEGRPLTVTLHKNGEITLSTTLPSAS